MRFEWSDIRSGYPEIRYSAAMRLMPLLILTACGGDSWVTVDAMTQPRYAHTATALPEGDVRCTTGVRAQAAPRAKVEAAGAGWRRASPSLL